MLLWFSWDCQKLKLKILKLLKIWMDHSKAQYTGFLWKNCPYPLEESYLTLKSDRLKHTWIWPFFFNKRQIIYPREKLSALLMWLISSCSLSLDSNYYTIYIKQRFQRRPWRWVVIVTWLCRDISSNFLSLWCIVVSVLIFSCHICFN